MNKHNSLQQDGDNSNSVFNNPQMFSEKFDSPERDEWQKPEMVIESLNLSDNAIVLEIGAGTGYFAVRFSKHLINGKIIAVDESLQMVEYLEKRAMKLGLKNVDSRLISADGKIHLNEKVDLIICVDVYHHISNRVSYFSNLIKHLKHEGKLVIIDRAKDAPVGPPPSHRIPKQQVEQEMEQAGLELVEKFDFLLPYQFYLVFNERM